MSEFSKEELFLLIGIIESKIPPKIIIPTANESAAISDKPKTAALYYDRVWCPTIDIFSYSGRMPDEIRFFGGTNEERLLSFQGPVIAHVNKDILKECHFPTIDRLKRNGILKSLYEKSTLSFLAEWQTARSEDEYKKIVEDSMKVPLKQRDEYIKNANLITSYYYRDIALAFSRKYQKEVVTVFSSDELQNVLYNEGDRSVISAAMEKLQIVDEKNITWDQVLELRRDRKSRAKYKRLLHWFDKEMVGKSQSFIIDEISIRLEDYENALKKHGIKTVIGTLREILDGKFLIGSTAISGLAAMATGPISGLLTEAGLIISYVTIKLVEKKLDYEEIEKGPNSEISWVYEVKKLGK